MTTTDTMDTAATVAQSIRMIEAGCEYVRITAPSIKEAQNLEAIKKQLREKGYKAPLVADIHFTPNAAELAARIVEKVRVNPGNYADKKKFENIEYTDSTYEAELSRIRERFTPLVKICKEYGTAMRIGTNHGSLSDRIMSRYGDTPLGMVESAMEFLDICEENNYHQIVLSMKASNPKVMVQAYRLLVSRMIDRGIHYPLHLGVTEAGEGEDGRIKSAAGIGALLEDGLGDTVRVSLTEDPEFEIPVARALVSRYSKRTGHKEIKPVTGELPYTPFDFKRRETNTILNIGGSNPPRVVISFNDKHDLKPASLFGVGYNYSATLDKWHIGDQACDYIYTGSIIPSFEIPGTLAVISDYETWKSNKDRERTYPLIDVKAYSSIKEKSEQLNFILWDASNIDADIIKSISSDPTVVIVLKTGNEHGLAEQRRFLIELMNQGCKAPVIIMREYNIDDDTFMLHASTDLGALLLDGFGDGAWMNNVNSSSNKINTTIFGVLQATRSRISKTEYISCPSCGRTLFDLQETTAKIRQRTDHLKGVKIGIMGCIVNGPGEMADADYGYVGTGVGKITLYKGRDVVQRNIDSDKAVDALIDLIKKHGDWVEKNEM
jgi:(E)-4-hydroxy-3-methylbut-2-enyl-diphosphate synthase